MDGYYAVTVRPESPPEIPKLDSVDGMTAYVRFPRSGKVLAFELHFASLEQQDAFMQTRRKMLDVSRYGGRLAITTPTLLVDAKDERQDGKPTKLSSRKIAPLLGIGSEELKIAHRIAWRGILDGLSID